MYHFVAFPILRMTLIQTTLLVVELNDESCLQIVYVSFRIVSDDIDCVSC